jgi:hypothetical protein
MSVSELTLPDVGAYAVVEHVLRFGQLDLETGGFLLAPRGAKQITSVACAGNTGITRRPELFQVSERALDRLFAHAEEHDLWIPAQFHSHMFEAGLSLCDLEHGLSVEGFQTTVIPFFHTPPADPALWGWWQYSASWKTVSAPNACSAPVKIIAFDEDGVRDA